MSNKIIDFLNSKKIELSSEKVELANVKDISAKLKSILKQQTVLDKALPKLKELETTVKDSKGMLSIYVKEGENLINDIGKKAKELGIDPNTFTDFKTLSIEVSNSKEYLK